MMSGLAEAGRGAVAASRATGKVHAFRPGGGDARGLEVIRLVAEDCGVPIAELFRPDRGSADAALARQLAMYLMHVQLHRLYSEVGRFFRRDRTTVSHACLLIEDRREVAEFDERVARLEAMLSEDPVEAVEAGHVAA